MSKLTGVWIRNGRSSAARHWPIAAGFAGCLLATGLLLSGPVAAAETMLFNSSAAQQCYLAALRGADARDRADCDAALEHGALQPADLAATLSNRGLLLARSGRFTEALSDHDRAISIRADLASLYINRSNTYVRAKRTEDAKRDLDRAITLAGRARDAALAASANADPAAVTPADTSLRATSELAAAHFNRALLLRREGDRAAALVDATRATELAPDRGAYRTLVEELKQLGAE